MPCAFSGTPPQARGADGLLRGVAGAPGNTPAGAGSSGRPAARRPRGGEHPRRRGEQRLLLAVYQPAAGTPPQARGAGAGAVGGLALPGNTPAGAGSRVRTLSATHSAREHPRRRGEQSSSFARSAISAGTPPQARGAGYVRRYSRATIGNTPAGAGSRWAWPWRRSSPLEHPRRRGEQEAGLRPPPMPDGTPPQARGADGIVGSIRALTGNTPARAGSRCGAPETRVSPREHPRRRGEQATARRWGAVSGGTPPQARGADPARLRQRPCRGNTPAGAGSSLT